MNLKITLTAFLVFLIWSSDIRAQGYIDILPDEVKNPFIKRHDLISKELEKPVGSEWAGRYSRYIGETWSEFFVWSPENGFAAFRDTCSNGPRAWVNYGTATFRDGLFIISPERDETAEYVLNLPGREFVPVKWGKQHWLIPRDKLALFAYTINSRSPDDYGSFYSKIDDPENDPKALPELPLQYKRLLGLPPIKAKVIKIGPKQDKWYPDLTINAGKNKGVIEGMRFWLTGVKDIDVKVLVNEVRDLTSTATIIGVGIRGEKIVEIVPKQGWLFTSRYRGY